MSQQQPLDALDEIDPSILEDPEWQIALRAAISPVRRRPAARDSPSARAGASRDLSSFYYTGDVESDEDSDYQDEETVSIEECQREPLYITISDDERGECARTAPLPSHRRSGNPTTLHQSVAVDGLRRLASASSTPETQEVPSRSNDELDYELALQLQEQERIGEENDIMEVHMISGVDAQSEVTNDPSIVAHKARQERSSPPPEPRRVAYGITSHRHGNNSSATSTTDSNPQQQRQRARQYRTNQPTLSSSTSSNTTRNLALPPVPRQPTVVSPAHTPSYGRSYSSSSTTTNGHIVHHHSTTTTNYGASSMTTTTTSFTPNLSRSHSDTQTSSNPRRVSSRSRTTRIVPLHTAPQPPPHVLRHGFISDDGDDDYAPWLITDIDDVDEDELALRQGVQVARPPRRLGTSNVDIFQLVNGRPREGPGSRRALLADDEEMARSVQAAEFEDPFAQRGRGGGYPLIERARHYDYTGRVVRRRFGRNNDFEVDTNDYEAMMRLSDIAPAIKRGVSSVTINGLPSSSAPHSDCTICQGTAETAMVALPCMHSFHKECLIPHLKSNRTCPNCRHEVE